MMGVGVDKPATSVSWFEAARFVNWLNTSTGGEPAYNFVGGAFQLWQPGGAEYDPNNLFRSRLATYFLPSADEWYKAAYYDPAANVYYDYPTGSDNFPDGIDAVGDTSFDAVFFDAFPGPGAAIGPRDINDVGAFSPYGTAGQGGNVFEWEETETDLVNDSTSSFRGLRGGSWLSVPVIDAGGVTINLDASRRIGNVPEAEVSVFGFRVASVAESSRIPSDLTNNGFVDFEDLTVLLANWNQDVGSEFGNLVSPGDTPVNFEDLTVLLADWTGPGPDGSPEAQFGAEAVPEPTTFLLAVAGLAVICIYGGHRCASPAIFWVANPGRNLSSPNLEPDFGRALPYLLRTQ